MPVLEVEAVEKSFGGIRAVREVSFAAEPGEILGLLGPNGAGKTTLIRMIMGIFLPDKGVIRFHFDGNSGALVRERVGYLPEERGLYGDVRLLDQLAYFGRLKGLSRREARERALKWLEKLGLLDWTRREVEKLSKGMQQKAQFIAAVLHDPDLVVLDEPFSGLDPVNQDLFKDLIRELKERGAAVLLSSHRMGLVEDLCDRIFLIHRGRKVLYGKLEEIKRAYGERRGLIRFRGDASALEALDHVRDLQITGNTARFVLPKGLKPTELLERIPDGIEIEEVLVRLPTLHEIFVDIMRGEDDEAH